MGQPRIGLIVSWHLFKKTMLQKSCPHTDPDSPSADRHCISGYLKGYGSLNRSFSSVFSNGNGDDAKLEECKVGKEEGEQEKRDDVFFYIPSCDRVENLLKTQCGPVARASIAARLLPESFARDSTED